MSFEAYILQEIENHPSLQPADIVKLCYQAAFGAEHLLSDLDAARSYLEKEYARTEACDVPLCEPISDNVCRINLGGWKSTAMPLEWLFKMFVSSASVRGGSEELFREYLETAEKVIYDKGIFSAALWNDFLCEYLKSGGAVHHSEEYRKNEKPAYRIAGRRFARLLPILQKVSAEKPSVIAIDGRAASGKSTMAADLVDILGAAVIHMDDFFLPPTLRTSQRLDTPGGNIHYERFIEEVLPHLSDPDGFSYRIFDCGIMELSGVRNVADSPVRIVEGSYSLHPAFGNYADITVFSDIEKYEQMRRILLRNGEKMAEMFRTKWIPLEENYFEHCLIPEKADIIL